MSKIQDLEDAQEFVDEYENIIDTMNDLYDNTNNKVLKQEVFELISVFEEDYKEEKENSEEIIDKSENEELDYQNYEYERSRI